MKQVYQEKGFAHIGVIVAILCVVAVAVGGRYVWDRNNKPEQSEKNDITSNNEESNNSQEQVDETKEWVLATTQYKAFSMKVPDGWKLTNYPGNFLGGSDVTYKSGIPAVVETSQTDYFGHSARFRASVSTFDDAATLGPQWSSPQPGLEESVENFSIGALQGKRFKGVFSQDLNQTLYEYVFDLGNNKKLDILYTIHHDKGEKDDVATVEKATKTISFGKAP